MPPQLLPLGTGGNKPLIVCVLILEIDTNYFIKDNLFFSHLLNFLLNLMNLVTYY